MTNRRVASAGGLTLDSGLALKVSGPPTPKEANTLPHMNLFQEMTLHQYGFELHGTCLGI